MDKVGRNDSCPCGSGKKYKKCCMSKAQEKRKIQAKVLENVEKTKSANFTKNLFRAMAPEAAEKNPELFEDKPLPDTEEKNETETN